MFDGLIQLIAAMAGLTAMSTASTIAYVHWRLERLEKCIDRANGRIDEHLDRKVD